MAKGKLSPSFRKAAKQIARTAPTKDDRVVDSSGRIGTVLSVAGGMIKVRADDGTAGIHPIGRVQKVVEPTIPTVAAPPKKKARKRG